MEAEPTSTMRPTLPRKVRVVARIRREESGSMNTEPRPSVSVQRSKGIHSSERVQISFSDQSDSRRKTYEVDDFYGESEGNALVFSKEIKPLFDGLCDGRDVSVIAFGARSSGKTYTIQGSEETPGLAAMAIAEIFSKGEEIEQSVYISLYEVFQDHIYDLLHPEQLEVKVLEVAQGKTKLKGLSQVPVKSVVEFSKIYFGNCNLHKTSNKAVLHKSHKGLIIHVLPNNGHSSTKLPGKINFIDLAGYEDVRRKTSDGLFLTESIKINKSLYAFLKVVFALNANEHYVPFRENPLTHMFRESLGGKNHVLMVTCLGPSLNKDNIYTLSLAARSCQNIRQGLTPSVKKSNCLTKSAVLSSLKRGKFSTVLTTEKRQNSSQMVLPEKKTCSILKGRKLFDEDDQINSKQALSLQSEPKDEEHTAEKVDSSPLTAHDTQGSLAPENDVSQESKDYLLEDSGITGDFKSLTIFEDDNRIEKANILPLNGGSTSLTAKLKEITDNLRSISSTPARLRLEEEGNISGTGEVVHDNIIEPNTPVVDSKVGVRGRWEDANFNSPWEQLCQCSSGMKLSFAEEYLNFLNTASKEELKGLKGIGEKRATYILQLREESSEPFKTLDDLQDIGLSAKQIKGMMKNVAGDLLG